ncbi:zinc finger protein 729-like [Bombina bombina]|uniref:zinc finger protein 729-like n=1 Tax=Bombina bombina TaxID=8345 RepID=UPI00235AB4D6|nr:zinc finger protein 729-like [Bombina bombina]
MDPEGWEMARPGDNPLRYKNNIFRSNGLQVNHSRYTNTGRLGKRTVQGMVNDGHLKLEGRLLQAKIKREYGNGFTSGEQCVAGIGKQYPQERAMKSVYNYTVKNRTVWPSDSTNHIENVSFFKYYRDLKTATKPVYGIDMKKLPIQVRDVGRTLLQPREKTHAQLAREDIKLESFTHADTKEPSQVFCQRTKSSMKSSTTEDMLPQNKANLCEESSIYLGLPLYHTHKRIMVPHQKCTTDTWQKIRITGQESTPHSMNKVNQIIHDKHRFPYKNMASQSASFAQNESCSISAFKTETNNCLNPNKQKIFRSSIITPNKVQADATTDKQIDKPTGNYTFRRFLLIDNQGLPYNVVVKEPKATEMDKVTKEPNSDSSQNSTTRSSAPRKVYTCPVCFRIFEYLSYLQRHSIAHSQQKPHICKTCGKAFKRTSHLTRHKYTHFGGKPFQCQICHRRFRDAGELTRHQQIHTGERPHQCDVCHMSFGDLGALQHHMLCKHIK